MPQYDFYHLDVFTNTPFGGNPLAVIPHADGLTGEQMQIIAQETNLSETTFVLPSTTGADFKVRIFTPAQEMKFAGHPVIGTHWLLAHLGLVKLVEPITTVTFELGVGNRSAQLHVENGKVKSVLMDHQKPQFFCYRQRRANYPPRKRVGVKPPRDFGYKITRSSGVYGRTPIIRANQMIGEYASTIP